jgi:hypothetical protein
MAHPQHVHSATITLLVLLLPIGMLTAQHSGIEELHHHSGTPYPFLENAGQVYDAEGKPRTDVRYLAQNEGATLYLRSDGLSYVFRRLVDPVVPEEKRDDRDWIIAHSHVDVAQFDVHFMGAHPACRVSHEDTASWLTRFYAYPEQDDAITARRARLVRYHEIYPKIDMLFYAAGGALKYDFILRPGARVEDIRLRYDGVRRLYTGPDGDLVAETDLGKVVDLSPVAILEGGAKLPCSFKIDGDVVTFDVAAYDRGKALTIDPTLIWGTFYGGSADDFIYNIAVDGSHNVYAAGMTLSSNQISTPGAHQVLHGGNQDAFVVKLDSSGAIQWATYYGANAYDEAWGVSVDAGGNVYFGGKTDNYGMATQNAYQHIYGGGGDAILVKLNAAGVRQWATYVGGGSGEYGYRTALDGSGNCYFVGYTFSTSGIASQGAHQTSLGGAADAFICKFTSSGALLWSTYYGGSSSDEAGSVAVDGSGDVYVAGNTQSTTAISTPGAAQVTHGGSYDGFIVKFSANGARQWGSYFGGSAYDRANYVAIDSTGSIYFTGKTSSTSGIATSGASQMTYGGGIEDGYIARMNGNGVLQWASYLGGSGIDEGHGIAIGSYGNAVVTGNTASSTGFATASAFLSSYAGGTYDSYAVAYTPSGSRLWGTYFGGGGHDYGYTVVSASDGMFYLCGRTTSFSGIATAGAHQFTPGGNFDGYVAKIQYTPGGNSITTGGVSPLVYCAGDSIHVPFTITGNFQPGNIFLARLSDSLGSFAAPVQLGTLPGTSQGIIHGVIPPGVPYGSGYRVRVVSTYPAVTGSDNGVDITIYPRPSLIVSPTGVKQICPGDSILLTVQGDGLVNVQWRRDGVDIPGATGWTYFASTAGTYTVLGENAGGCRGLSDSLVVEVLPALSVSILPVGPITACAGDSVILRAFPPNAVNYTWYRDSVAIGGVSADSLLVLRGGAYYATVSSGNCQAVSNIVQVDFHSAPRADVYPPGPITLCQGDSVLLSGPTAVGYSYQWYRDNQLLPAGTGVHYTAAASGVYTLVVTNSGGCSAVSNKVVVAVAPSDPTRLVWTGALDTLWTRVGNWDNPCAIPTTGDTVIVPPGGSVPLLVPAIELSVLQLDHSSGLVLGGLLQITQELRMLEGHIECGGFDIQLGSGARVLGASHTSFVVTNGTGRLVKNGIGVGGAPFPFPVGFSKSDYLPLTIQNLGSTDQFGVRVSQGVLQHGVSGSSLSDNVVDATWHINEQAPGGSNATLSFQWDTKHELVAFDNQHCAVARYSGNSWSVLQAYGFAQATPAMTRTVSNVTSFSPFIVTDSTSAIPVELSSFTAIPSDAGILLCWTTETEVDNFGFEVQRRPETQREWNVLGFVPGHGSTTMRHDYRYLDAELPVVPTRYRLRQVDSDGSATVSHDILLSGMVAQSGFTVLPNYPNPFNPATTLSWYLPAASAVWIEVYNEVGQRIMTSRLGEQFAGRHFHRWTAPDHIGAGIYHYRVHTRFGTDGGVMIYLP